MNEQDRDDIQTTGKLDLDRDEGVRKDRFEGERLSNRYLLEKLLDRGGFGGVYKGIDSRFDSQVAIKVLTPPFSDNEFRREAKLNRAFRHPNVVEVYDYGIDRGLAYIVMEYLRGDRVDQLLHNRFNRLFPLELLDKFVYEITSALQNAHEQALVHRDLKPQNVMLIDEGKPTERFILLDFGIAAQTDATNTMRNSTRDTAFTPNYGAPERFTGEETDHRTDIYSFGIILYELVTGTLPFQNDRLLALMQAVQHDPPPTFEEVAPHVKGCEHIETLIMRCLEKQQSDRPQSMAEVREEYFEARKSQIAVPADRARFVDQWSRDAKPDATTEMHYNLGDTDPTIDAPDTGDVTAFDTDRAENEQLTAAQEQLLETVSVHRRRSRLTMVIAALATTAAIVAAVMLSNRGNTTPSPPPAKPWFPSQDFQPAEGAALHREKINGQLVYDRIERVIPGENERPVVFILVADSNSPAKPFYIMQNEAWNGLYHRFADENNRSIGRDGKDNKPIFEEGAMIGDGSLGADNPRLPVVNISAHEADRCAAWLGGRLPTVEEWNTAAGYYQWKLKSSEEGADALGPFQGKWPPDVTTPSLFGIDREAPLQVGTAKDDVSEPYKCHDMAGNVEEWTCNLTGTIGRVPVSNPDPGTFVKARGKCYSDPMPYLYIDFDKPIDYAYEDRSPFVGFRVVIEIK